MIKYILTVMVFIVCFNSKALTKSDLSKELVYSDRAYTWFFVEYTFALQKVYGASDKVKEIIAAELKKYEKDTKKRLVEHYTKNLSKSDMLALTMPSLVKPTELVRINKKRGNVSFLSNNVDLAESIGKSLITKLDLHTWNGTDKFASVLQSAEKTVALK